MVFASAVTLYVADKIVSQFIKEEGYGWIKRTFFPAKKYKNRLYTVILDTIDEFERLCGSQPLKDIGERFPFYKSQILFDLLNQHILFKTASSPLIIEEFKKNENIIVPTADQLQTFYDLFTKKVNTDATLKKLHFEEGYKAEIFQISAAVQEMLTVGKAIFEKVIELETSFNAANAQVQLLRSKFDESVQLSGEQGLQGIVPHPRIEKASARDLVIAELLQLHAHKTWIWIHGSVSMGKTQLAVLLAGKYSTKFWINLRDTNSNELIPTVIRELSGHFSMPSSNPDEIKELILRIPPGSLLILDDMPKLSLSKSDWLTLVSILEIFKTNGNKILTTSSSFLSTELRSHFDETIVVQTEIPSLTETEVEEILLKHGASQEKANLLKPLVRSISEGHPTIVTAICRHLVTLGWSLSTANLAELFVGNFEDNLDEDTYERIVKTVSDPHAKELLYRLKVVIGTITNDDVEVVSAVKPILRFPHEKVTPLSGLWIRRVKTDSYELSPLIKRIRNTNLSPSVFKAVNKALGQQILSTKKLTQYSAYNAAQYFISAEAFNEAGFVLSLVLEESLRNPDLFFNSGFFSLWTFVALPEKMDLFVRSVIRYLQIVIYKKNGEDGNVDFLVADLEQIVEQAAVKNINVGHAALLLATVFADKDSGKSNRFLLLGLKQHEQMKEVSAGAMSSTDNYKIESFIWNSLLKAKSAADFEDWLAAYSNLSETQQKDSVVGELHQVASLIFCAHIYDNANLSEKPSWEVLVEQYELLIQKIAKYNLGVFVACCIKFQIRCLVLQMGNVTEAINCRERHLKLIQSDATAMFLVNDELGRQLFYYGDDRAMYYLLEAAAVDVPEIFTEKIETYAVLSEALGESDKRIGYDYAHKAFLLQAGNQFVDEVFAAKIIGEYAIAKWELGNTPDVFYILEAGVEKLLLSYKPLAEYQGTIVRYGHAVNYYYHILSDKPLPLVEGQPYSKPSRGFFSKSNEKLLEGGYYFEQRRLMQAYLMVVMFESLNDLAFAKKWAGICLRLNEEDLLNPFSAALVGMNTYLILDDKYEEAMAFEVKMLSTINELNSGGDIAKRLESQVLATKIKDRPLTTFDSFDDMLFEHVLNFIIIKVLWKSLETASADPIVTFVEGFDFIIDYFENKKPLLILKNALLLLAREETTDHDILQLVQEEIQFATQTKLLIYLIASLKSSAKRALELHLALIQRLEKISMQTTSDAPYKFIVVPFLNDFWEMRTDRNKSEFASYSLLQEKGLSQVRMSPLQSRLKKLFRVLCFHLEYDPNGEVANWLGV